MKAGAFILSVLFLIMLVQPMFIKWNTMSACPPKVTVATLASKTAGCKKTCSSATANAVPVKKPVKQKSDDPCNTCNPFMSCNACPYIKEEPEQLVSPAIVGSAKKEGLINVDLSSYYDNYWHPPELFMRL